MKKNKYNIPQSLSDKKKLLKQLFTGEKTLADLANRGYKISLWRQCEHDTDMMESFAGDLVGTPVSKAEYEQQAYKPGVMRITLDLS